MTAVLAPVLALRGETAPAVIDERGVTSWGALDERVTRLVRALRARGLEVGDTVVAMLGNQVELVEVSLACAHGGWALVPVNWHWVARELAYVLGHAGAPNRSTMYAPMRPAKNIISVDRNSHKHSLPLGIGSAGWYSRPA